VAAGGENFRQNKSVSETLFYVTTEGDAEKKHKNIRKRDK